MISGIGTLVGIYSLSYLPALAPARVGRYYAALLAFMGAMLGVALADDLILLFIFWEVTSLTSFLLIGFWYEQEKARKGALTALLVTALGGLAMMIGFIIVGTTTGSFSLRALTEQAALRDRLAGSPLFVAALLADRARRHDQVGPVAVPFLAAGGDGGPDPGLHLPSRRHHGEGGRLPAGAVPAASSGRSPAWAGILVPIGLATFLLGAVEAFLDTDLKGILAQDHRGHAGAGHHALRSGRGRAGRAADVLPRHVQGGAVPGGRDRGACHPHAGHPRAGRFAAAKMPITFFLCILGALSLAGVWPTFGFLAKEALYAQLLAGTPLSGWVPSWLLLALTVLANALLFAVACRLVFGVFFGAPTEAARHSHEVGPGLWLSPMVLAGLSLGLGVLAPATSAIVSHFSSGPGTRLTLTLAPDHLGPLLLSVGTFLLGFGIYRGRAVLGRMRSQRTGRAHDAGPLGQGSGRGHSRRHRLQRALAERLAPVVPRRLARLHGGTLRPWRLQRAGISVLQVPISLQEMTWYGLTLCGMLGFTAVMVARSTTRLGAAIALTSNGFLTALLFVVYRSPDILLTQILIETVSTIFLLLILYYLPVFRPEGLPPMRRFVNVAVSVAVGATMFSFVMLSTSPQFREVKNLGIDYLTRSMAQAGGANAVNVIIVDFRAMDTNGEITVLVLVGLLVYGLLRTRRKSA